MGKGKTYELTLKNDINAHTDDCLKAHRPDFSGSSVGEVADILFTYQDDRYDAQRPCGHAERHVVYAELKKRSCDGGNRATIMAGSSDGDSGLEELGKLATEVPYWATTKLAVKFDHRELVVLDADTLFKALCDPEIEYEYATEQHGIRLTPSDNISMVKPELDWWPSSTAGQNDYTKLLIESGVDEYYINE